MWLRSAYSHFLPRPMPHNQYSTFCYLFFPPQHLLSSCFPPAFFIFHIEDHATFFLWLILLSKISFKNHVCYYNWKHIRIFIFIYACIVKILYFEKNRSSSIFSVQNGYYHDTLFFAFSTRVILTRMRSPYNFDICFPNS